MYQPSNFRIVTNSEQADFQEPRLPERLQGEIPKLLAAARKGKPKIVETLKKLIRDFQKFGIYKNLLYTAYLHAENYGAAEQVAEQMFRMHPKYPYARANYADSLLRRNESARALEVLHPSLNIMEAFPGRQSFHLGEFMVYERSAIMYLAQTGATQEAEERLKMLGDTGPIERELLDILQSYIDENQPFEPELPALQTPHLEALYFAGSFMTAAVIRDILQQPREALLADLLLILDDLTDRADYWSDEDFPEYVGYVPVHAMMLLAELKAEEALPTILRFLSQPEDVVDQWLGDFSTELLPEIVARLATPAQYERLSDFATNRSINGFISSIAVRGVVYGADLQPTLREPATQWLESVILQLMPTAVPGNDNLHLDLAVSSIIDLKAESLLPMAKTAFDQDLLDESISGDYAEFVEHLADRYKYPPITHYASLEEAYHFIWSLGYVESIAPPPSQANNPWLQQITAAIPKEGTESENDGQNENGWQPTAPALKTHGHISQNAPCPCGSGKKYKRCHGREE